MPAPCNIWAWLRILIYMIRRPPLSLLHLHPPALLLLVLLLLLGAAHGRKKWSAGGLEEAFGGADGEGGGLHCGLQIQQPLGPLFLILRQ